MSTALTEQKKEPTAYESIRHLLETRRGEFAMVLPKHLPAERLVRLALSQFAKTPQLLQCSQQSLLRAMMFCAERGLEPVGEGGVWLTPRNVKQKAPNGEWRKAWECVPITDWRGLVKIMKRGGEVRGVESRCVYARDEFRIQYGTDPKIEHVPTLTADRGDIIAVYAVATITDGTKQFEVMSSDEVDGIRKRSPGGDSDFGPWKSDWAEMARKTVVRRLAKYVQNEDVQETLRKEDEYAAAATDAAPVLPEAALPQAAPPKTRQLAAKLRAKGVSVQTEDGNEIGPSPSDEDTPIEEPGANG